METQVGLTVGGIIWQVALSSSMMEFH